MYSHLEGLLAPVVPLGQNRDLHYAIYIYIVLNSVYITLIYINLPGYFVAKHFCLNGQFDNQINQNVTELLHYLYLPLGVTVLLYDTSDLSEELHCIY